MSNFHKVRNINVFFDNPNINEGVKRKQNKTWQNLGLDV